MPPLQASFSVLAAFLRSRSRQAFVYFSLDIIAAANGFVEEASGMAFVESVHDLFAALSLSASVLDHFGWILEHDPLVALRDIEDQVRKAIGG